MERRTDIRIVIALKFEPEEWLMGPFIGEYSVATMAITVDKFGGHKWSARLSGISAHKRKVDGTWSKLSVAVPRAYIREWGIPQHVKDALAIEYTANGVSTIPPMAIPEMHL